MRPVHVIVTADHREADAWASAFGNGIELYRFSSNNEAFERLIGATSPIQLLVISPSQDTMFNMRTDELVRRLVSSPVGAVPQLSGLGVVVIAEQVPEGPRVVCCSTIETASRFVLYGEREPAPEQLPASYDTPVLEPHHTSQPPSSPPSYDQEGWGDRVNDADGFASRLIDSLWGDEDGGSRYTGDRTHVQSRRGGPAPETTVEDPPRSLGRVRMPRTAARISATPRRATLFGQRAEASRAGDLQTGPAVGAEASQVAPHLDAGPRVAIEDEPLLQPAREIMLERRGFQGDGTRGLAPTARHVVASGRSAPLPGSVPVPGGSADAPAVPIVPAVAGQVTQMLYGGAAERDPLLGWSSKVQDQLAAARLDVAPAVGQPHVVQQPQVISAQQFVGAPIPAVGLPQVSSVATSGVVAAAPAGGNFAAPSALLERGERDGVSFG